MKKWLKERVLMLSTNNPMVRFGSLFVYKGIIFGHFPLLQIFSFLFFYSFLSELPNRILPKGCGGPNIEIWNLEKDVQSYPGWGPKPDLCQWSPHQLSTCHVIPLLAVLSAHALRLSSVDFFSPCGWQKMLFITPREIRTRGSCCFLYDIQAVYARQWTTLLRWNLSRLLLGIDCSNGHNIYTQGPRVPLYETMNYLPRKYI